MTEPVTEAMAWAKCPDPDKCRASSAEHPCIEHPCLMCYEDAGDIVAGLRLGELRFNAVPAHRQG